MNNSRQVGAQAKWENAITLLYRNVIRVLCVLVCCYLCCVKLYFLSYHKPSPPLFSLSNTHCFPNFPLYTCLSLPHHYFFLYHPQASFSLQPPPLLSLSFFPFYYKPHGTSPPPNLKRLPLRLLGWEGGSLSLQLHFQVLPILVLPYPSPLPPRVLMINMEGGERKGLEEI